MAEIVEKNYTYEEVETKVIKIFKEELGVEELDLNVELEYLDIDSLSFAELLVTLENEFDKEMEVEQILSSKGNDPTVTDFIHAVYEGLNPDETK
ncbi:phosphopantetheine-binding protein [Priestia megaterium]|uniref:phosphopantetheine-binding protein n=1 Tax=Priestia megaterium TaxID=1404 RepID=UPI0012D8C54F|nr:Acyl carrier protein [Priestia megaterium]